MSELAASAQARTADTERGAVIPVPGWFAPVSVLIAVGASLTIVEEPIGLGVTLTLIALYAVAAIVIGRFDRFTLASWVLAGALAAMATLRSAGWLVALSVAGSLALAAIACTGAATWSQLVATAGRAAAGLLVGLATLFGLLGRGEAPSKAGPFLRGAIVAAPLLLVFGALFASADAVFRSALDDLFSWLPGLDMTLPARLVVLFAVATAAGASVWMASRPDRDPGTGAAPVRRLGQTEWTVALGALAVLFALFVGLQATALVQGHAYILETAGLTYADYVHEGFLQQMIAAALTLSVVAGAWHVAAREGPSADRRLRFLLGVLCLLTLAILASSVWRVDLYMDAFGATRLRLLVIVIAVWLAGLFVLVLAVGLRPRAPWLPRAAVMFTAGLLLALALLNPDAWIAERNIKRYEATGKIDLHYLGRLSHDAVPSLMGLAEPPVEEYAEELYPAEGWAGFNVGRENARAALAPD